MRGIGGLIISAAAIATAAFGQYAVTVIPPPSGLGLVYYVSGINSSGQVAMSGAAVDGGYQVYLASPSGSAPIPLPPGWLSFYPSYGYSINTSGQIAGDGLGSTGSNQTFIGTPSGSTAIPFPSGSTYDQVGSGAVNDSGQVAGSAGYGSSDQGFIGTTAGSVVIPLPSGWSGSSVYGINSTGHVAGVVFNGQTGYQPFIGNASGSTAVPLPSGWTGASASAINDFGQISGYGTNSGGHQQAFVGNISGIAAIPLPFGATTSVVSTSSINNNGIVVGQSDVGGWIWDSYNGTRLLNTLVPAGWTIGGGISIASNGLILAWGTFNGSATQYYVVLSPFPCTISINPITVAAGPGASSGSFTVTTGAGCAWTAVSNNSFLSISSGAAGSGNGTVNYNVAANTGVQPLTGTITITGPLGILTFTVDQSVAPPAAPTLVSPANGATDVSSSPTLTWNAASGAASYIVRITTSPAPDSPNLNVTQTSYSPQALLAGTTYYWQILSYNVDGETASPVWSFTTSNSCALTVSPNAVLIGYSGGPASVTVSAGTGCAWTATSGAAWLTITGGASGTGSGTTSIAVGSNTGNAHLGFISFTSQKVGVMQGGSPSAQIFNDVPSTDPFFDYISVMETYGVTLGCQASPPLYCPSSPVTRAEMAAFLIRAYDLVLNLLLTYPSTPYFQDVPPSGTPDSQFFPDVQRLAQLGITLGCQASPPLFCPDGPVSQGEMAAFLIRAWMLLNNVTTLTYPTTPYFTDVPATDQFFSYIQKMAQLGFWTGCGGGQYCESSTVTRDQMAPMILRSMLGAP